MAKIKVSEVKSKRIKYLQDDAIPDINTPWQVDEETAYPGSRVEEFIKKMLTDLDTNVKTKIGYWCWSGSVDASNFYHLWGFASEDDCTKYKADPEGNAALLLVNEALPISTVQGDSYSAYLYCNVSKTADVVVSGNKLTAKVRFCAVKVSNGERLNNGSMGTLIIERSTDGGSTWTKADTINGALVSTDFTDSDNYSTIDLGSYLVNGKQKLRVRAQYNYTSEDGTVKTSTSTFVQVGASITKTTLKLECNQSYTQPLPAKDLKGNGFPLSYIPYGDVAKTLHVQIVGGGGTKSDEFQYAVDSYNGTPFSTNIKDATDKYKLWVHGVRTITAWLTCSDGLGGTLKSNVLVNRFMVVNADTGGADLTKPYLLLQNVIDAASNFTQAKICDYAVFSPSMSEDGSIVNQGEAVDTIFYLTGYTDDFLNKQPDIYFVSEIVVPVGVNPATGNPYELITPIEIETEETQDVTAYFRVYRRTADGTLVNFMEESQGDGLLAITVDVAKSFAPAKGASFLLNPKLRSNAETAPATIQNAKDNNKVVESEWSGFDFVKDGWVDSGGVRVLRVPSGRKLTIKYNPLAQFRNYPDSSMTFEMDILTSNITDEKTPVFGFFDTINTTSGDSTITTYRGLRMCGMHGNFFTKSHTDNVTTDFGWQEGRRVHIAINIHNKVAPNNNDVHVPGADTGLDITKTSISLVRVIVNGVIRREMEFSTTDIDELCLGAMSNGGIVIGCDGVDIDIYSLRCYTNSVTALDPRVILNDKIATLPTTEDKEAMYKRNDIYDGSHISRDKVEKLGKRTLTLVGKENYHYDDSAYKIYYRIKQYDNDGNDMPENSGTICKHSYLNPKAKGLTSKRQGSTARTYYDQNIQTDQSKVKDMIWVAISQFHSSITVGSPQDDTQTDGTTKKVVMIKGGNLGKTFAIPSKEKAKAYDYKEEDGVGYALVPDGWFNDVVPVNLPAGWEEGYGYYRGVGYQLKPNTPLFQKGVNKVNIASCNQSHLTGINNLYNDLAKAIGLQNAMQQANDTARISKYTEPFYYFWQDGEDAEPLFRGPSTFGAGKMDKVTWGYDKKEYPMFAMFEGSDNNLPLLGAIVPFTWNKPDCPDNVTYRGTMGGTTYEGIFYNGQQNFDFDGGDTEEFTNEAGETDEKPKEEVINVLANAWNFLFLHNPKLKYYNGTFDDFLASDEAKANTDYRVWCTKGDDAYLLKRYSPAQGTWVNAGLWDENNKIWNTIDIRTSTMTAAAYTASSNKAQFNLLNEEMRAAIVNDAKTYMGFYFNKQSVAFYYAIILLLFCGTDNSDKNTYFVINPVATEVTINGETRQCYLIELHSDDVDSMIIMDNNGQDTHDYYVDRLHPCNDGETQVRYGGMENVLFNLCEWMWMRNEDATDYIASTLGRCFTAMTKLVSADDHIEGWEDSVKVSVWGCLYKYIFYVQSYFCEAAYNEAARIRYEYPQMLGFISSGAGARGVSPITQSMGDIKQDELQFMKRRLVMLASYAGWGEFADGKDVNVGLDEAASVFSIKAAPDPVTGGKCNYTFDVTPHQYIYPTATAGQNVVRSFHRVAPGETYSFHVTDDDSVDTGIGIRGANYYRSFGNLGDISTNLTSITIVGNRLTEFIAKPTKKADDGTVGFRPQNLAITAKNVSKVDINGCSSILGSLDLSALNRLESVDARGTSLQDVTFPNTTLLTKAHLPATIMNVDIENQPSMATFSIEGYSNLQKFILKNNKLIDTYTHAIGIYSAKPANLKKVVMENIAWNTDAKRCKMDMLMYYVNLEAELKGIIFMLAIANDRALTLSDKLKLCNLYGNIDSEDNDLYISYEIKKISSISISGKAYMTEVGKDYQFDLVTLPASGNNLAVKDGKLALKWTLADTAASYGHLTDDINGIIHVDALSDASLDLMHELSVSAETTSGTKLTASRPVGFYKRIPRVGDFAYGDGTFDSEYDPSADLMGLVYMREPIKDDSGNITGYKVRICAKEDLSLTTTDKATTWSVHRWGLYPDNGNGFLSSDSDIASAAGFKNADYDVEDIAEISNIGSRWNGTHAYDGGSYDGVNYNIINDATYLDANAEAETGNGYKAIKAGAALSDYNGKDETEKIVAHANAIILNYLHASLPESMTELADAMQELKTENSSASNVWRYEEFYYPAAYGCYLYEPEHNKDLDEQYQKKNWYLPGEGELGRLYNFKRRGTAASAANYNAANEAVTPIFANANKKAGTALFAFVNNWYWSGSEYNRYDSWNLGFNGGYVYNGGKYGSSCVRPCTAFIFKL